MYFSRAGFLYLSALLFVPSAWAVDIEAGKLRASTCFGCHGPEGISANPKYPNLAGQSAEYLMKQLNAFRSGARKDPIMMPMVSSMSDADVENVAAFFARFARTHFHRR
jgi:cytochrome c553